MRRLDRGDDDSVGLFQNVRPVLGHDGEPGVGGDLAAVGRTDTDVVVALGGAQDPGRDAQLEGIDPLQARTATRCGSHPELFMAEFYRILAYLPLSLIVEG